MDDHMHCCTGCGKLIACPDPWCMIPTDALCERCGEPATARVLSEEGA